MSTTPVYDFEIVQGASVSELFTVYGDDGETLVDISGCTARWQARDDYDAAEPVFELTEADGITLGGAAGTILIEISDEDTAAAEIADTSSSPPKRALVHGLLLTWPTGQTDPVFVGSCPLVAFPTQ